MCFICPLCFVDSKLSLFLMPVGSYHLLTTGIIARMANIQYCFTHGWNFRLFAPQERHVAPMGWSLVWSRRRFEFDSISVCSLYEDAYKPMTVNLADASRPWISSLAMYKPASFSVTSLISRSLSPSRLDTMSYLQQQQPGYFGSIISFCVQFILTQTT